MELPTLEGVDFDALLTEVEMGTQGAVANIIRKLRESEALAFEMGKSGPMGHELSIFSAHLERRLMKRSVDIEATCNDNYDGFAESTGELLTIQEHTSSMRNSLTDVSKNLNISVQQLDQSTQQLFSSHSTRENIDKCIHAIQNCLPVIEQFIRVEDSIKNKRHYHALKSLEYLEKHQFQIVQQYAFSQELMKRVPDIRGSIKIASQNEVIDFLEDIRTKSVELGQMVLNQTASNIGIDINTLRKGQYVAPVIRRPTLSSPKSSAPAPPGPVLHTAVSENLQSELDDLEQIAKRHDLSAISAGAAGDKSSEMFVESITDFSTVYRCLHIHSVLNEKRNFEHYLCNGRKKQINIIMSKSPGQFENILDYYNFFSEIIGFFVVDDHLRHTLPGVQQTYQAHLDDVWTGTTQRILQFVQYNAKARSYPFDLLVLKDFSILFIRAMTSLGFATGALNDMIDTIKLHYESLLAQEWQQKFERILAEDNYTAIHLANQEAVTGALKQYPGMQVPEVSEVNFPKSLPYSMMVPQLYVVFREYTDRCMLFTKNMDYSWTELEDNIARAVNNLLALSLLRSISNITYEARKELLRLIQLSINIGELEQTCMYLEFHIQAMVQPQFLLQHQQQQLNNGVQNGSNESPMPDMTKVMKKTAAQTLAIVTDKWRAHKKSAPGQEDKSRSTNRAWLSMLAAVGYAHMDEDSLSLSAPPRSRLQAGTLFREVRTQAEDFIYSNLKQRVDEFCELAQYQGIVTSNNAGSHNENAHVVYLPGSNPDELNNGYIKEPCEPSDYIVDMINFLNSIFSAFTNLPPRVAQTACIQICRHINESLRKIILGPNVRMISEMALKQMSLDLEKCESFAKSDSVTGLDKQTILELFQDLRQLLSLASKADWQNYIELYQREPGKGIYSRVLPSQCLVLLEKLRESDRRRTGFMQMMSKDERDRRKQYEDIQRKLKELNQNGFIRTN